MSWKNFANRFHKSWHSSVSEWFESANCVKVYSTLKNCGKEIAPKSTYTFRSFECDLEEIRCVILMEEPYCEKYDGVQYADGIPLSCEVIDRIHPQLNEFYDAMEREFYGFTVHLTKNKHLDYYMKQGVMFLNRSLTVEIGSSGSHKTLWDEFFKTVLKTLCERNIPLVFCGEEMYQKFRLDLPPLHPHWVIKQPLTNCKVGTVWNTEEVFTKLNAYLYKKTKHYDVQWCEMEVPY